MSNTLSELRGRFNFVSPGIYVNEVDQSQPSVERLAQGPVIIGRFPKGPMMRPVVVKSKAQFMSLFGAPHPGGAGGDPWRGDAHGGPTYAAYAAEAHLHSAGGTAPATIFRLAGEKASGATGNYSAAGWTTRASSGAQVNPNAAVASNGGAYGLFVMGPPMAGLGSDSLNFGSLGWQGSHAVTGTLAAVFYLTEGSIQLVGNGYSPDGTVGDQTASLGSLIRSHSHVGGTYYDGVGADAAPCTFKFRVLNSAGTEVSNHIASFIPSADLDSYSGIAGARDSFNCDPTKTNASINTSANTKTYWLGETYQQSVKDMVSLTGSNAADAGQQWGVLVALHDGANNFADHREDWQNPSTGWFFSQDQGAYASYHVNNMEKLFKFHALDHGEWAQNNLRITISNIEQYTSSKYKYGSFDVSVESLFGRESSVSVIETFSNCNLDRNSPNYICKKIGDRYLEWNSDANTGGQHIDKGSEQNKSSYIRVEVSDLVKYGDPSTLLPWGVYGPSRLRSWHANSGSSGFFSSSAGVFNPSEVSCEGVAGFYATGDASGMPATHPVDSTVSGVAATATITFTGSQTVNRLITITSADGTARTYTGKTTGTPGSNTFDCNNGAAVCATSLMAAINNAAGHSGKITATNPSSGVVLLTQDVVGIAGNTTITNDFDAATVPAGFSGGSAGEIWFGASGASQMNGANFKIEYPSVRLVATASIGGSGDRYHNRFGIDWSDYTLSGGNHKMTSTNGEAELSVVDALRRLPKAVAGNSPDDSGNVEYSWVFTLDDIVCSNSTDTSPIGTYTSGSRVGGTSYTAASGSSALLDIGDGKGFHQFSTCLAGGHDGLDICEREPFRNTLLDDASGDKTVIAMYNTMVRALDTVKDPEYVECNIITAPGLTENNLTDMLISHCESRGDALGIIDVDGGYIPGGTEQATISRGSVKAVWQNMRDRTLDSSYGCAYYPWVQVRSSQNKDSVWVPPSVVALGTMASSTKASKVWFAPAGFTRGGLDSVGTRAGSAGLKVMDVRDRLTSTQRDRMYENRINPIAKFPAEGIVVFGQKTLQVPASALDRINVRRLLLHVKKQTSIIAATTMFSPNDATTWAAFKGSMDSFLDDIKSEYGLQDYKVVLDETTTTDDLIDANVLYAQVYLKPTKAIEFILVDFIVTSQGASFDD